MPASPGSQGLSRLDDAHLVSGRQRARRSGGEMRTGNDVELSHVVGIRQPVEQGLHRLLVLRMDPVRIEFGHRHQDESPLMETGMRNGEQRGLDDPLSIEQQIQINGAGHVSKRGVTTEASFRFLANGQQVFRLELRLKTNDPVIKPRVVVPVSHVDGFGLVIRRDARQRGMRKKPHQGHGPVTKVPPVSLVRSKGDKDGFDAHLFTVFTSPLSVVVASRAMREELLPPDLFEPIHGFG